MLPLSDDKILHSWHRNAAAWTRAVREGRIASRVEVTNAAIVDAIVERRPTSVLDVGCGEGWLARALAARSIPVVGVDAVPALVDEARAAGGGEFHVVPYDALAHGLPGRRFAVVVCNFSLLGDTSVERVLAAVPPLLADGGALVIQTLHPLVAVGDGAYRDGWRAGSWDGFGPEFSDPAPWYFRTLEGWVRALARAGLHVVALREPTHPRTGRPASVIFVAEPALPSASCAP